MSNLREIINSKFNNIKDNKVEIGIGGFTAMVRITETVQRTATIPTLYLEDGTHVNDHIIVNPTVLTITGDVSDNFIKPRNDFVLSQDVSEALGNVNQYLPSRTATQASKVVSIADDLNRAVDRIDSAIQTKDNFLSIFNDSDTSVKRNQKKFIDRMNSIFDNKEVIKISMPEGYDYENMVITSFEANYDNDINSTGFNIVATQLRFTTTKLVDIVIENRPDVKNASSATDGALSEVKEKGVQEPQVISNEANISQTVNVLQSSSSNFYQRSSDFVRSVIVQ